MTLVIVEDFDLILTQLLRMVARRHEIVVVGIAADEESAVSLITEHSPDAVLLDLALAPGSGIRVLERIRRAGCSARVLVLTNNMGSILQRTCEEFGISGFYDKSLDVPACMDRLFSWLPAAPEVRGDSDASLFE